MIGNLIVGFIMFVLFAILWFAMNPPTAWLKKLGK